MNWPKALGIIITVFPHPLTPYKRKTITKQENLTKICASIVDSKRKEEWLVIFSAFLCFGKNLQEGNVYS